MNNVAIDLYEESKKVVKEDFDKPIMPDTAVAGKPIAVRMAFAAEPGPGLLTIHSTKQCANKHEEEVFKQVMITGKPYDDDVLVAVPVLQRGVPKRYRGLLDKFGNPEKKKNMPYYPSESTRRNNKMKFKKIVKESADIAVTGELRPWVKKLMRMIGVGKSKVSSEDKKSLLEAVIAACDKSEPMYADLVGIKDKYFGTYDESNANGKRQNESEEGGSDHPRIYVGTYAKYNDGSIDGKWIDISEYNTYEEFVDACRELHKDEKDPEFMVQDFENFPRKWYHEGGLPTEEEFNKINDYYLMDDTEQRAYEAYVNYTDDDDIDNFHEAYEGQFSSASDFAYSLVDDLGWDGIGSDNIDMYFDYDAFGRDLMFDFHMGDEDNEDSEGNPEDPDHYYDNDGYDMGEYESDDQVARDYIDGLGGVSQLGPDTARNYFDYEAFGRDLLMSDFFEEDGFVFRHI